MSGDGYYLIILKLEIKKNRGKDHTQDTNNLFYALTEMNLSEHFLN